MRQGPERFIEPSAAFLLDLTDAVDHVDDVEEIGWDRHGAEHVAPTFLQAFENDDLAGQVDAFRRQRRGFGYAAAGVMKGAAEGPYLARRLGGRLKKRLPFFIRKVKPPALLVE
jgi:hypothetical protein